LPSLARPAADADPRLLCRPVYGTAAACWFWNDRRLSLLANRGWFRTISRRINGGYNGLADRLQYWHRHRAILGLPPVDVEQEAAAIKAFQRQCGLATDGVADDMTIAALAAPITVHT
jgi:hypothetical protein